jgi:hypothetical protein
MYPNLFFAQWLMEMRVEEALRTAELNRWLREAGIQRRGWLSRQGCWLLCQLGRLLVVLGQYLQKRYQVPPLSLKEQVT